MARKRVDQFWLAAKGTMVVRTAESPKRKGVMSVVWFILVTCSRDVWGENFARC
jgi:hypothetical protein